MCRALLHKEKPLHVSADWERQFSSSVSREECLDQSRGMRVHWAGLLISSY